MAKHTNANSKNMLIQRNNSRHSGKEWTKEEKRAVWEKGEAIPGKDPRRFRKDPCGDIMEWEKYGDDQSAHGWEIDHTYPQAKLEKLGVPDELIHDLRNLRPMQASNNATKSDDYPIYHYKKEVLGQSVERQYKVNASVMGDLQNLYREYLPEPVIELRNLSDYLNASLAAGKANSIRFRDDIINQSIFDLDDE